MPVEPSSSHVRTGMLYAFGAYGLWGLVPLYFKSLECQPKEIVAHRVLWSALLLGILLTVFRRWPDFVKAIRSKRTFFMLLASAYLVAANWYIYIFATTSGQITQASLGYFILPLVNVVAGILLFGERLRRAQAIALLIAAAGVLYLAISQGGLPWIGLSLAVSFAFYGIVRKVVPVDGVVGLSVETVLLAPTAIAFLVIWERVGGITFAHGNRDQDILIALSGIVTTTPLIFFAQAVRRVSLVTIGVVQYMAPTLQLILGVTWFGEEFVGYHQISFGLIWFGLSIYVVDGVRAAVRKHLDTPSLEPVPEPLDGGVPLTESHLLDIRTPDPRAREASP